MANQTPPHRIILTLQDDGTMTAKVEGIAGPGCQGVTDWLHDLGDVIEDQKTADFYGMTTAREKEGRTLSAGGTW